MAIEHAELDIVRQVFRCLHELKAGTLTEPDLLKISEMVKESTAYRQDVLYLQARTSSPVSEVMGMRIIEKGDISDGPSDPEEWPYETVLDAVRDGWRIIKFPEMALMLDEKRTYGLGYEFILERLSRW